MPPSSNSPSASAPSNAIISTSAPPPDVTAPTDQWANFTVPQLRDELLAAGPGPLDPKWVAAVNAAEAEYWRRSTGVRVGHSDELLAFDCGGQQWVLEVAFPVAQSLDALKPGSRTRDLEFLEALMADIKKWVKLKWGKSGSACRVGLGWHWERPGFHEGWEGLPSP